MHKTLRNSPSNLIAGRFVALDRASGPEIISHNPASPGESLWQAREEASHIDDAVLAAKAALPAWSSMRIEQRMTVLRRLADVFEKAEPDMARLISDETGKPIWDAKGEASALAAKIRITLDDGPQSGYARVSGYASKMTDTRDGRCWFRPHGVMAVVGPFNFPAHLPNGHIVPALLMGNTIVFKPSDKTPAVGQFLGELLHEALDAEGSPPGVVNVVHGGVGPASKLVTHEGIDGILFTGSWAVGRKILEANLDHPGRIIALEMGGNNPAIIMPDADLRQAAIECVRSAFVSSGQRCTCTRRIIVHESVADRFIGAVVKATRALTTGAPHSDPPVFMGPMVTADARDSVLEFQKRAVAQGAEILVEATIPTNLQGHYITPGVMRVPAFTGDTENSAGCDVEVFGPMLRISVSGRFEDMLAQANATRYGLASSIFTKDKTLIDRFLNEAKAGCVNVNTGTAGASSKLPFGGLGVSGNHRPAGAFSLDYCAYPVAGLIETGSAAGLLPGMQFDDDWLK